jgi:hypothetical protein
MLLRRTAIAAALVAAPLAFAAPTWAQSGSPDGSLGCSPCARWENVWKGDGEQGPWEKATNGSWENVWKGKGQTGPWEKATNGSWENTFPAE